MSSYVSMIKWSGKPILPPVMSEERRAEAIHFRNEAVRRERLRARNRALSASRYSHDEHEVMQIDCRRSRVELARSWRSGDEGSSCSMELQNKCCERSPSRIPRSTSLHSTRPSSQFKNRLLLDRQESHGLSNSCRLTRTESAGGFT